MLRHSLVASSVALLALTACGKTPEQAASTSSTAVTAPAPAAMANPPARKPGLWSQTVTVAGATHEMKMCLDAATERTVSAWGGAPGESRCAETSVTPIPGGWRFHNVCDRGASGKTTTTGQSTGDMSTSYTVKATTVTTGAASPAANGTHEMSLVAKWTGPCPAGMAGGDMMLPGGQTISMRQMTGMMDRQ
jgi:hypothetical protein